jgi:hypothetical protein
MRLRAENRHLLTCLLRREGLLEPEKTAMIPKVSGRQRVTQLEAQKWSEWYGSVAVAQTGEK